MENRTLSIHYELWRLDELTPSERSLAEAAREAAHKAYAPYSRFHVGAALRLANGEVLTGCNQENASFPAGTCAERTALFAAGAKHPDVAVEAIAIAGYPEDFEKSSYSRTETASGSDGVHFIRISPCGICRQVLLETEKRGGRPIQVLLCGETEVRKFSTAKDLLPFAFEEI